MDLDYIWIVIGILMGAFSGAAVPALSNKLMSVKKRNKTYETWHMSNIKKSGYITGTVLLWIGLSIYYPGWKMFYIGIVLTAAMVAAYIDSIHRILPNEIVFNIAAAGFIFQVLTEGILGVGKALLAMALGGLVFFLASILTRKTGAVGAGDVKYIMASGAMVGFPGIINCLFFMAVGLAIYCVGGILIKKLTIYSYFAMGVFISIGLIMSFFSQPILAVIYTVLYL